MESQREIYRHLRERRDLLTPAPHFTWPEISDGQILITLSPSPRHDFVVHRISQQLTRQINVELIAPTLGDVEDEEKGKLRRPDVIVIPESAFDTDAKGLDPREILLAVEVVSPNNPENDYEAKLCDYPVMGIPHYLIVDPRDGTCRHHWEIVEGEGRTRYDAHVPYRFGDLITIGEWTVDTGTLPRYDGTTVR
ncbi:Uma2 family endonuclease [Streptomyces sp. NBC_01465]|uniref:Uma2 family endonuclease n=1 Tax=Streptomyces sp. NBC_01465 TaxID=2903878 RepID=UPI002E320573|nr:Uma2 family endonuclease [Streptomyces sp. NBC_01465]